MTEMQPLSEEERVERIRALYRARATTARYATSPDFNLRELEIEALSRSIGDARAVLDVGCGNGYSTLTLAARHQARFVGIDFVQEMIDAARAMSVEMKVPDAVQFLPGDVTALAMDNAAFDVVISQRCLLNLPSNDRQWQALREISRVLRPGGRYLALEGTMQGLEKLNTVRERFGLSPIPAADPETNWSSNKFDEQELLDQARGCFARLVRIDRFGMYYFLSRVVHPLLVAPNGPRYDAPINEVARRIASVMPDLGEMGHVALFVFER